MKLRLRQPARSAVAVLTACVFLSLGSCSADEEVSEPVQPGPDTVADGGAISADDLADAREKEQAELDAARDAMLATPQPVDIATSCTELDAVLADDVRAASSDDVDALNAAYLRAMDAREVAPDETFYLLDMTSRLVMERTRGPASQETTDAVRDATPDTEAACAAAGVTLTP